MVDVKPAGVGPSAIELSIGTSGLRQTGGRVFEEFHPHLRGDKAFGIFEEMSLNDGTLGAMLNLADQTVLSTDVFVEPNTSGSAEAMRAAEVWEQILEDMDHTWSEFQDEANSEFVYGFAPFEWVPKQRKGPTPGSITLADGTVIPLAPSRYTDGLWGLHRIALRAQDTRYKWQIDRDGTIRGLWQQDPYQSKGLVYIPAEKLCLLRTTSRKNNPEGLSDLRRAYRPWFFKKRVEEFEAIGVERDLAGIPVVRVPISIMAENASTEDKALRAKMFTLVKQIKRDEQEGLLFPAKTENGMETGYDIGLLTTGGARQFATGDIARRYQGEIAMVFLGQFLLLSQGAGSTGSNALASSHTTTFAMVMGGKLKRRYQSINRQIVQPVSALNGWGPDEWPEIKHGDIETPDLTELGDFLQKMTGSRLIRPSGEIEKRLLAYAALPEPTEEWVEPPPPLAPVLPGQQGQENLPGKPPKDPNAQPKNLKKALEYAQKRGMEKIPWHMPTTSLKDLVECRQLALEAKQDELAGQIGAVIGLVLAQVS